MSRIRSIENFIEDWDRLMFDLQDELPTEFIQPNGFQNIDEMVDVLNNALDGNKENGLLRIRNIRNYLIDTKRYFSDNYPFNYRWDEEAFDSHEEKLQLLTTLINDLQPNNFNRYAELITPKEIMNLRSLTRQKRIPPEIEREISSYIGNKPLGGQKKSKRRKTNKVKKTRNIRKNKKSKKLRKNRKSHKYSFIY